METMTQCDRQKTKTTKHVTKYFAAAVTEMGKKGV